MMTRDEHTAVTSCDRQRLREMTDALCASLPASGQPYGSYLRALDSRLSGMATVQRDEVRGDLVTMNSTVAARDPDGGRLQELTLVYPGDADAFGEKVSVLTPLGARLLGSRVGDVVEWETRRGTRRLRVERIVFQPEAAGQFDL